MFNVYPYQNINDLNLDYLLKHLKEFMAKVSELEVWKAGHNAEYEQLKGLVDDLYSGNFPPEFVNALIDWYRANIVDIIGELIKTVVFGITDTGYFVAYIPESWDDIIFTTSGLDEIIPGVDYGRLILSFNV